MKNTHIQKTVTIFNSYDIFLFLWFSKRFTSRFTSNYTYYKLYRMLGLKTKLMSFDFSKTS